MTYFAFEQDFVSTLRCIPMEVRWRLDTCGIKLKLAEWNLFSLPDRQLLSELPFATPQEQSNFREHIQQLIFNHTGTHGTELEIDIAPPWLDGSSLPDILVEKLNALPLSLSLAQWKHLSILQRFALIKLCRSSHEHQNFIPALQEFGCIDYTGKEF